MASSQNNSSQTTKIALIGAGTIGLSFAALHLQSFANPSSVTIYDVREDLDEYVQTTLPSYLTEAEKHLVSEVRLTKDLAEAVKDADIIQEQGPENVAFKQEIWEKIEQHAPSEALLWTSTSGIPASVQSVNMKDKTRLIVAHPYNPPHVMPLIEVVPSPLVPDSLVERTVSFWKSRGREAVVMKKECTGFVSNRLAFALLRESIHLVKEGVVTVEELDRIVETSMGPRWAVWGPFKSYHAGGGPRGLEGFVDKIGESIQACWDESGKDNVGGDWQQDIFEQSRVAYGTLDTSERDTKTREVLSITRGK